SNHNRAKEFRSESLRDDVMGRQVDQARPEQACDPADRQRSRDDRAAKASARCEINVQVHRLDVVTKVRRMTGVLGGYRRRSSELLAWLEHACPSATECSDGPGISGDRAKRRPIHRKFFR